MVKIAASHNAGVVSTHLNNIVGICMIDRRYVICTVHSPDFVVILRCHSMRFQPIVSDPILRRLVQLLYVESDTGNTTNFVTLRPIKGKRYVMWPPIQCPPREPMMKLRLHPHQNGVCSNWWLYYTYPDHSRPINEETRYDMLSPNRNESRSFTVIETINKSKYSTKKDMTRKSASEVVL